jgi:hypothetical protein
MDNFALKLDSADAEDWVEGAGAGAREPSDWCSREGALALKAKIEAYWRERGQDVMIALHNVGFHPAIRAARYDVRSDMVNGMPRRVGRKSAPAQDSRVEESDLVFE